MKIGINARFLSLPYTGIGQYTKNLVTAMAEKEPGNEYILFVPELSDISFPENVKQVRVAEKDFKSPGLRKAYWEHVLVPEEMEKFGVTAAHFPYPCNPRKKMIMPVIVTVHDVIPWKLKAYRNKLRSKVYNLNAKLALKRADHIITVSDFSKKEIVKYLKSPEKNVTVIPLAPPPEMENTICPAIDLRRKYFLYVGGFDDRKNVPLLMKAYQKHIAPKYPIDLIIAGGKDRGLERFLTDEFYDRVAGRIPVKPKGEVIFTEPLSLEELHCLYKQAMALAHMSRYEGFNLALVEAMKAGIPIVTSDIPPHREVTKENALFADPYDVDSIGIALHQIVHDSGLRKELAERGIRRAEDFGWGRTAEETLYVYSLFH